MASFQRDLYSIKAGTIAFSGAGNRTVTFTGVGGGLAAYDDAGNLIANFGKGSLLRVGEKYATVQTVVSPTVLTLAHDTTLSGSGQSYELYAATAPESLIAGLIQRATMLGTNDNPFTGLVWDDGESRMRWVTDSGDIKLLVGPTRGALPETATHEALSIDPTTGSVSLPGLSGFVESVSVAPGAGLSVDNTDPANPILSNTGVLGVSSGAGIVITGGQSNRQVANDGVTTITNGGGLSVSAPKGAVTITSLAKEKLTADRTYYVRTDGNNSNTGLVNSAGGAFLTVQRAIDAAASLSIGPYNVTISVQAGTYSGSIRVSGPWDGTGTVRIVGTSSPTLTNTSGVNLVEVINGGRLALSGVGLAVASATCLMARYFGVITVEAGVIFGASSGGNHMVATTNGIVLITGNYSISGGAASHYVCEDAGLIRLSNQGTTTLTITGSPAFNYFGVANRQGNMFIERLSYSGTVTGTRHYCDVQSLIYLVTVTSSKLPGSVDGAAGSNYSLVVAI